jgi:hypothetical protein
MSFFNFQLIFFYNHNKYLLETQCFSWLFFVKKKNMNKKLGFWLKICVYSFLVLMVIVFSNIFYCFFLIQWAILLIKKLFFLSTEKKYMNQKI